MWQLSEDTIATNWPNNRVAVLAKRFADVANQAFELRSESFIPTLDLIMGEIVGIAMPAASNFLLTSRKWLMGVSTLQARSCSLSVIGPRHSSGAHGLVGRRG